MDEKYISCFINPMIYYLSITSYQQTFNNPNENKKHSENADTSTSVTLALTCDVDLVTRSRTLKLSKIMLRFDKFCNHSFL